MALGKVLVADDSRTIRTQLQRTLSDAGYDVVTARDGNEALEQIRFQRPILAVLDVNMPSLDGYGVCQELKRMGPPWDRLPVIFLTVLRSRALEVLGGELGAYLHKPVAPPTLLKAIRRLLAESPEPAREASAASCSANAGTGSGPCSRE